MEDRHRAIGLVRVVLVRHNDIWTRRLWEEGRVGWRMHGYVEDGGRCRVGGDVKAKEK